MDRKQGQTPTDPSTRKPKIRKVTTASDQTQSQSQAQSQPIGELLARTRRIDPMDIDDLDEVMQVWSQTKENPITLSEDQIEYLEAQKYLEEIEQENRDLQDQILKRKEKNEKMDKYIEEKVQAREAIVAKQKCVANMTSMIREQMNALTDELIEMEESIEHSEGLNETLNSKGEEAMQILTNRLLDLVSKTEDYEAEIRLTDEGLTIAKAMYEEAKNKVIKEKERVAEANRQLEEYTASNERNEEKHQKQMAKKIKTKNLLEQSLKIAEEENSKIDAQYKESLETTKELASEFESLQAEDTADANKVEFLKSNLLEHQELEAKLNNELDEVMESNIALISNRDSEAAEYRKQLQDLESKNAEATENLEKAALDYENLLKTSTEATEHKEQLKKSVEDKNNEMKNLTNEVNDALEKNKELLASIGDLKAELAADENILEENRAAFVARNAEQKMKNEAKIAAGKAEVAAAEKLLSEKSDRLTEEMKIAKEKQLKTWTELKIREDEILRKRRLVNQERNIFNDLESKLKKQQLDLQENLPNHCQQLEHAERIKKTEKEIEYLNKQISAEKMKLNQIKRKNKEADRREIEKQAAQDRKHRSHVDDLKKKLAAIEQEIKDLEKEDKIGADREATPKSILRSRAKSPLRGQKVQFDIRSSQTSLDKADSSSTIDEGESRSATTASEPNSAIADRPAFSQQTEMPSSTSYFAEARRRYQATANKPDWSTMGFPTSLQETETPSEAPKILKPPTPRKFFKSKDSQ